MATAGSLSDEFDCPVCFEQLKQPKFIGPCNHTVCRDCIEKHWISLGRKNAIPCPKCREHCPIPQDGVDGLKDNFMLVSIMDRYENDKGNKAGVLCSACPKREASHFCKECDGLNMCPKCCRQHDLHSATANHDVFGLCSEHGKPLTFYCLGCGRAICSACLISTHKSENHDVKPHQEVVQVILAAITKTSSKVNEVISGSEEVQNRLRNLDHRVKGRMEYVVRQRNSDVASELIFKKSKLPSLREKSETLQEKIDNLMKEKAEVDEEHDQLSNDVVTLEEKMENTAADVRRKMDESSDKINSRLQFLSSKETKLKEQLKESKKTTSGKIVLDAGGVAFLKGIGHKLHDGSAELSEESNYRDLVREVEKISGLSFHLNPFRAAMRVYGFPAKYPYDLH